MDKSSITKAFNTLFFSFLDDIISIFPEKTELLVAKTSFETIKQMNTTAILKCWYSFVYTRYQDQILKGDLSFFIEKDYNEDLNHLSNSGEIIQMINKIRDPIRQMSEENKKHSLNYVQKLSKLSEIYSSM